MGFMLFCGSTCLRLVIGVLLNSKNHVLADEEGGLVEIFCCSGRALGLETNVVRCLVAYCWLHSKGRCPKLLKYLKTVDLASKLHVVLHYCRRVVRSQGWLNLPLDTVMPLGVAVVFSYCSCSRNNRTLPLSKAWMKSLPD